MSLQNNYNNIRYNINPSDYSGANYQLALNISRVNAEQARKASTTASNSSFSRYGSSSSEYSDSIQASSSGSHMSHCYFGSHSSNYVTITRG